MFYDVAPLVHLPRPAPHTFTYKSSERLAPGILVRVPLRHQYIPAVVIAEAPYPHRALRIKTIPEVLSAHPIFPPHYLQLARWLAEYYVESLGLVLRAMLPTYLLTQKGQEAIKTLRYAVAPPTPMGPANIHTIYGPSRWKQYEAAIKKTLAKRRTVLFLVPENALIEDARARLGQYAASVTVVTGEATWRQQWERWRNIAEPSQTWEKKADIILGTRAAVFAPLARLGLIVVERESGSGYKSFAKHPRYRAQDVALKLAGLCGAHIILGDSAPSVERWRVKPVFHPPSPRSAGLRRGGGQKPGRINIVDARQTPKQELYQYGKAAFVISAQLKRATEQTLKKKKGVLMFAARRGAATSMACADCGWVAKCDHCEAPLVYYAQDPKQLRCRHCGALKAVPAVCANCRSWRLKPAGVGTQEVARVLKKIFPEANIEVFDSDTAATAKKQRGFLERFRDGKIAIIVATQLIFNKPLGRLCGLIGVVRYDQLLAVPEFRAEEDAYRALLQLSALLEKHGRIIAQTFIPEHRVLKYFRRGAYANFLKNELTLRKKFHYPPFWQLIRLAFQHKNQKVAAEEAHRMAAELGKAFHKYLKSDTDYQILGPVPAFIPKMRGKWRWNIIIKLKVKSQKLKVNMVQKLLWERVPAKWDIDVDPESIL